MTNSLTSEGRSARCLRVLTARMELFHEFVHVESFFVGILLDPWGTTNSNLDVYCFNFQRKQKGREQNLLFGQVI